MMDILHCLIHAAEECLKIVPFLYLTLVLIEWLEHRSSHNFERLIARAGRLGPAVGSLLGCVPQCGFSAACATLFNSGLISAGTLLAVFLSTSDEALPILLANPAHWKRIVPLLLTKVIIALLFGMLLDFIWHPKAQLEAHRRTAQPHRCSCHGNHSLGSMLLAAARRMLSILAFLFVLTFLLHTSIEAVGKDAIAALLLPGFFQPLLTAIFGLIPNCATSVLLTQLYLEGFISFGSVVAGLSTAAGIGLLILLRGHPSKRTVLTLLGALYAAAALSGMILQLLF